MSDTDSGNPPAPPLPVKRHASLYFPDGTFTLKVNDSSMYYNVYRQPLILKSDCFGGMLTLPGSGARAPSLSQSSQEMIEAAKKAGQEGTSDETAVVFPAMFNPMECEVFLEFIFNIRPWTKDTPALEWLNAVLKTSDFFGVPSGMDYATYHLEDHPDLGPAMRYNLASTYKIPRWAKRAFDELMSSSMLEISEEDDLLLGWDAYRTLVRTHAEVAEYRISLALFPPEVVHSGHCYSTDYCASRWAETWSGLSGGMGSLLRDELSGSEMHDTLADMKVPGMTGECRLLTITSIQDTPEKKSVLRKEEDIIENAVQGLVERW